jgi:hypothetical protein
VTFHSPSLRRQVDEVFCVILRGAKWARVGLATAQGGRVGGENASKWSVSIFASFIVRDYCVQDYSVGIGVAEASRVGTYPPMSNLTASI